MRGLNSRSFIARWQALYAASNPGLAKDRWEIDGVEWVKERHARWGEHYSYQFEIHRLEHRAKPGWTLLVVTERWWGPDRTASVRETIWCRALSGNADRIVAWIKKNETNS